MNINSEAISARMAQTPVLVYKVHAESGLESCYLYDGGDGLAGAEKHAQWLAMQGTWSTVAVFSHVVGYSVRRQVTTMLERHPPAAS